CRGQRVQPELGVIALIPPVVLVLRAIADQEEEPCGWQTIDEMIEQGLGPGIDPLKVLEDQAQGLDLALAQEQALDSLQGALAPLGGIEGLPFEIFNRHIQERQEDRQCRPEGCIQRDKLTGDLLTDFPYLVAVLNLKVGLKQVNDEEIRGSLAVGDRAAFKHKPATGAMGLGEFVEEAGRAYSARPPHRPRPTPRRVRP